MGLVARPGGAYARPAPPPPRGAAGGVESMRPRSVITVLMLVALCATLGAGRAPAAVRGRPPFTFGTFTVNSSADDDDGSCQQPVAGDCTLREAINASNATTVTRFANQIKFA